MYLCYSDRYFNHHSQKSTSYLNRSTSFSVSSGITLIGLPLRLGGDFVGLGLEALTFRVLGLFTSWPDNIPLITSPQQIAILAHHPREHNEAWMKYACDPTVSTPSE